VLSKPDLVAPGWASPRPGSGYLSYSGVDGRPVAGVAALLRQANPTLSAQSVADVLRLSAADIGAPGVDPARSGGSTLRA
jgi:subtilisin family serine protease